MSSNSKFSGILAQARGRDASQDTQGDSLLNDSGSVKKEAASTPKPGHEARKISAKERLAPPDSEATATPSAGRPRGKRSDPNFTQITAYISKTTHQNIKVALLNEGQKREISELIEAQLVAWLAAQKH